MPIEPLVTTRWLADRLGSPELRVVDMRGHVRTRAVAEGVDEADYVGARDEYLAGHIPGAVYVDWTSDIVDPDDPVPAQIAPAEREPAADRQAYGKPAPVAGRPPLRNRRVE